MTILLYKENINNKFYILDYINTIYPNDVNEDFSDEHSDRSNYSYLDLNETIIEDKNDNIENSIIKKPKKNPRTSFA